MRVGLSGYVTLTFLVLVTDPPGVVTTIKPVVAPVDTVTLSLVAVSSFMLGSARIPEQSTRIKTNVRAALADVTSEIVVRTRAET